MQLRKDNQVRTGTILLRVLLVGELVDPTSSTSINRLQQVEVTTVKVAGPRVAQVAHMAAIITAVRSSTVARKAEWAAGCPLLPL